MASSVPMPKEKDEEKAGHSILNSSFPVYLPKCDALFFPEPEFQAWLKTELGSH
jgi:hypothetical protein